MEAGTVELTDVGIYGAMRRYGDLCIHAVIDLSRTFSRGELERAVAATLADFTVLGKRYQPGFWRDRWLTVEGPISDAVHVEETADLEARTEAWLRRSLVATRERPLRVVALAGEGRMRMILSVLHLAVDGAGIAAVAHVLGSHLHGTPPALPVERRRDIWRALDGLGYRHAPVIARDLVRLAVQTVRHFAAARRERAYGRDRAAPSAWRHIVIASDELRRIQARCSARTSVNDLLIAALARVAAGRSRGGPVVIAYTMDLRRYARAPRLTATNSSSILTAVVPRSAAAGDLEAAAGAVAAITARHRKSLVGPAFMLGPYALGAAMPHGVARALVRVLGPVLVDMPLRRGMLVTNVGRIDQGLEPFADDILSVRIVGPNVVGLPVPVVVAFGYRGDLHLDVFAPPGLGEAALDELEGEIAQALA